jgi:hypothetical protein
VNETQRILLGLLVVFVAALLVGWRQASRNGVSALRPIPAFGRLHRALRDAMETGRAVHVALGLGGIWSSSTADSLAGLEVLGSLAAQTAPVGLSPVVTAGDATVLPLAQDAVRRSWRTAPAGMTRPAADVRWMSPAPAAYAAGVMGTLGGDKVGVNVMVGSFGNEYLLMGEAASQRRIFQVGGASEPTVVPFVYATADEMLLGEDMYAAGAYLARKPWHLGSLWAQDFVRWIVVLAIFAILLANTLWW